MTKDHETDTDDLVERLENSKGWPNLGKAAAARIRELEAENARWRGALQEIAGQKTWAELTPEEDEAASYLDGHAMCIERARAALEEKNDD